MNYVHIPTGKKCVVLQRAGDRSLCDFGLCGTPFTWVPHSELRAELTPIEHICDALYKKYGYEALDVLVPEQCARVILAKKCYHITVEEIAEPPLKLTGGFGYAAGYDIVKE